MIKTYIPKNNVHERRYILEIIFNEFLGLEYQVSENDGCQDWEITLNDKKLIIKDTFFFFY